MGDLISRSALLKYLRDYKWEFAMGSDFSKAMEMIDAQPTAYNVDAVVAELEKNKEIIKEYEKYYCAVRLCKAIDIVKRGGVE